MLGEGVTAASTFDGSDGDSVRGSCCVVTGTGDVGDVGVDSGSVCTGGGEGCRAGDSDGSGECDMDSLNPGDVTS